jgi:diguanylate cyclase (GGDEF)-like protein
MEAEQMNELAHKDALTGLGNKLAYDKALQLLNQELKQGRTAFGVAVIDLNDLKKINDAYGHDCGSMSLRQISSLICNTFVHSPVFRIGGDEFTVVLRGNDYDRIEELVSSFYAAQSELAANPKISPWDRVSAALGYALYDAPRDHSAEDVFRRADEKMYEQKKQMKASRKDGV